MSKSFLHISVKGIEFQKGRKAKGNFSAYVSLNSDLVDVIKVPHK